MKLLTISEGSKEMLPFVEVEITTGRFPFQYWYEVSYWSEEEQAWYHHWEKDGGAFGFWRALRKAECTLSDVWFELLDKIKCHEATTRHNQ